MSAKTLVLQNQDGHVVRTFAWEPGEDVVVVRRNDTKRLEVVSSTDELKRKKISFTEMGQIKSDKTNLAQPILLGALAGLSFVDAIDHILSDDRTPRSDNDFRFGNILLITLIFGFSFVAILRNVSLTNDKVTNELKSEVVRIAKAIPRPKPPEVVSQPKAPIKETKKSVTMKRLGALAALGSLSKSNQKSGLDLGAMQTSRGPGLGGLAGSGGVQQSIYAKGIVSAPLGAGGNIQGAGGYGTKGKGGGQAGYGTTTLVGSLGTKPIGLSQEATVDSGLDKDQIDEVIQRNLGQVRFCYEQSLQADSALSGRVAVKFIINGSGQVSTADIASSSLQSKMVEECILLRLKSWKFPAPRGGVDVKVSYPFLLRRAGQG